MYYTYVLYSGKDQRLYTGITHDLKARLAEHMNGRVSSTWYRRPLKLIYYEACRHRDDAIRRERYLKSGRGKRYLKKRLVVDLGELIRK